MIFQGPDVTFSQYTIYDVHTYTKASGYSMNSTPFLVSSGSRNHFKINSLHAASASTKLSNQHPTHLYHAPPRPVYDVSSSPLLQHDVSPSPPDKVKAPQANATQMFKGESKRSIRCPICFQRHPPNRCWARDKKVSTNLA